MTIRWRPLVNAEVETEQTTEFFRSLFPLFHFEGT
jgi:hypothetical protein